MHPVDRQRDVGVPPLDLDGVPLEVVQSEVARAAQLGLPSAEVDVHLRKKRECMVETANHLFVNFGIRLSQECLSDKKNVVSYTMLFFYLTKCQSDNVIDIVKVTSVCKNEATARWCRTV